MLVTRAKTGKKQSSDVDAFKVNMQSVMFSTFKRYCVLFKPTFHCSDFTDKSHIVSHRHSNSASLT